MNFITEAKRLGIDISILGDTSGDKAKYPYSADTTREEDGLHISNCGICRDIRNEVRAALANEAADKALLDAIFASPIEFDIDPESAYDGYGFEDDQYDYGYGEDPGMVEDWDSGYNAGFNEGALVALEKVLSDVVAQHHRRIQLLQEEHDVVEHQLEGIIDDIRSGARRVQL